MSASTKTQGRGQALVEFALIIGVLLMIIFVVIEGGHLLHANLTVQSAAREAGRYAITGQFDTACLTASPPCADPKVASIKAKAEEEMAGLGLDPNAVFEEAGYYLVEVFGTDAAGNLLPDSAGMPGRPIIIRVSYRAAIWTPLLRPIAETVMVSGQTVMNNERVVQANSSGDTSAPPVPQPPPIEPTLPPPPDLVLSKSGPSNVTAGSRFNYTLSLVNEGLSEATNVVLTDTVPSGLSDITANPSGPCSPNGSNVTCTWPLLPAGDSRSVTINVLADGVTPGEVITNTATVTLDESDANADDNEAQAVTQIVPDTTQTDLEIFKSGPDTAPVSTAGSPRYINYEITVRNNGPNEATGVVVTDTLPSGVTYDSASGDGSCSPGTPVTCDFGQMTNGQIKSVTIRVQTPVDDPGQRTNTATVSAASPGDSNTANNSASQVTNFVYQADLRISKTGSPSTVIAGELLTYTLNISNQGPHDATAVRIVDSLPYYVTLQTANYSIGEDGGPCSASGTVVTCPIGDLAVGATASATIVVIPQRAGTLVNSATVTGDETDPDTINSATAVTMVDAVSDLAIRKTISPDDEDIFAGDVITYTLTVTNSGPSRATGVTVIDDLQPQLVFQSVETNYGSCDWNSVLRRITCWLGALSAGAEARIEIRAIPVVAGPFSNAASVEGNEDDPVDNNNSDVTTSAREGDPFIIVNPSCGPAGTTIQIEGYLWSHNRDVTLSWTDENGNPIEDDVTIRNGIDRDTGYFVYSYDVADDAYKETIRIRAEQEGEPPARTLYFDTEVVRVPCSAPDLEITSLVSDTVEVEQYEPVTYTVTVMNTGDQVANDSFFVSLYAFDGPVSPASTHLTSTNRLDVGAVSGLTVGEVMTLSLRANSGFAITGTHYIYALVDSDPGPAGAIAEMYEDNNLAAATVNVIASTEDPPPDPGEGDQQLFGETYIDDGSVIELQPYVRVTVYDGPGGALLGTTYSDAAGSGYQFTGLPAAANYYVEASITVDGVLYSYEGTVSPSPPSQTLVLQEQPE